MNLTAPKSGTLVEAVRYHERIGLTPVPPAQPPAIKAEQENAKCGEPPKHGSNVFGSTVTTSQGAVLVRIVLRKHARSPVFVQEQYVVGLWIRSLHPWGFDRPCPQWLSARAHQRYSKT